MSTQCDQSCTPWVSLVLHVMNLLEKFMEKISVALSENDRMVSCAPRLDNNSQQFLFFKIISD